MAKSWPHSHEQNRRGLCTPGAGCPVFINCHHMCSNHIYIYMLYYKHKRVDQFSFWGKFIGFLNPLGHFHITFPRTGRKSQGTGSPCPCLSYPLIQMYRNVGQLWWYGSSSKSSFRDPSSLISGMRVCVRGDFLVSTWVPSSVHDCLFNLPTSNLPKSNHSGDGGCLYW